MQKTYNAAFIPNNYSELLSELKEASFNWEIKFSSMTENKTIGHISHYALNDAMSRNNCLILIPGLASNTRAEPLMKVVEYWALTNKYDIYCIDTFLGDFLPEMSQKLAQKHTFAEYINLIDAGLDVVEHYVRAKNIIIPVWLVTRLAQRVRLKYLISVSKKTKDCVSVRPYCLRHT